MSKNSVNIFELLLTIDNNLFEFLDYKAMKLYNKIKNKIRKDFAENKMIDQY